MSTKKIVILGAGASGMNIFQIITDINKTEFTWNILGYFVEGIVESETLFDLPIKNNLSSYKSKTNENIYVISAIGSPTNRERVMISAIDSGFIATSILHPSAQISEHSQIEEGAIICQNCVIQPFAIIKRFAYIHTGTVIGPEVEIEQAVTINSLCGISAKTTIHSHCYIGVGTQIIQGTTIEKESTIGAGSVVLSDIPNNVLVVGSPAKVKKENNPPQ